MSQRFPRFDPGWLVAAILPLIGILPTLSSGVINTADGPLHVQRIFAMGTLLREGILWPRWVSWFHLGFGYPIFNFYPPGVFYLGGLFGLAGISAQAAFTLVAALAWILGSMGMYGLARRFVPPHAAVLAAMLWAYAPSRLFEVWDQGSLPQMMAAAMIPWLLSGLIDVTGQPSRRGMLAVALPLAGLILSHQPMTFITALFVAPLTAILLVWQSRREWRSIAQRFAYTAGGLLLGVGLTAIFLVPLAAELRYVQAARGAEDNIDYLISNFLQPEEIFAQPQPADLTDLRFEMPTTLGLVGAVLAIPGFIALLRRKQYGLAGLLALGLGFTLFMLVESSLPVWLGIPFFRQLRFPERFLRMGSVLIALAGCASILLLPRRWQWAGLSVALIAVLVAALPIVYPNQEFLPWQPLTAEDEIDFEIQNFTWGTTSYDEFDPMWGEQIPLPINEVPEKEEYATNPFRLVVSRVDMARYGDIMQVEQLEPQAVKVTLSQDHIVRFHQYYFPGWTATVNGAPAEIFPDPQWGLISLELPEGEHTIRLAYTGTTMQAVGLVLTVLSVGSVILLAAMNVKNAGARFTASGAADSMNAVPTDRPKWLENRSAAVLAGAVIAFALVNTLVITPNTLLFRHQSPPDSPIYMQQRVDASFGDTFRLLGYTLNQDTAVPGGLFSVMLFWRAEREIDQPYRPIVQLVNLPLTEAWSVSEPFFPGGGQTVGYPSDRFASEVHEMRVFENAPPYMARILVQMVNANTGEPLRVPDGSDRILLEPLIRIQGNGQPTPGEPIVTFGDTAALYCVETNVEGDDLVLRLGWRVVQTPAQNFTTFVHALDADGEQIDQADAQPMGGNYPPQFWLPGQWLRDEYRLPNQPEIAQIALGLYNESGRLSAPLPDNRLIVPREGLPCPR